MKPVTMIAAALVSIATATSAFAWDKVANPQEPAFKVEKAQLAIKSPDTGICPAEAKVAGWIFTNKAGPVTYMLVRKGGQVGFPQTIQAVKGAAGYVASFSNTFQVLNDTDAEYRILVSKSGGVVSNWAPLKASCQ